VRPLLKLLLRLAILASPLALSFVGYFVFDPFKVLRPHARYCDDDPVILNRDFVSTEEFLKTREPTRPTSFILGNSRSLVFHSSDWRAYLPPGARFQVLEDVGHFVHIEQPRRIADLVLEFLS